MRIITKEEGLRRLRAVKDKLKKLNSISTSRPNELNLRVTKLIKVDSKCSSLTSDIMAVQVLTVTQQTKLSDLEREVSLIESEWKLRAKHSFIYALSETEEFWMSRAIKRSWWSLILRLEEQYKDDLSEYTKIYQIQQLMDTRDMYEIAVARDDNFKNFVARLDKLDNKARTTNVNKKYNTNYLPEIFNIIEVIIYVLLNDSISDDRLRLEATRLKEMLRNTSFAWITKLFTYQYSSIKIYMGLIGLDLTQMIVEYLATHNNEWPDGSIKNIIFKAINKKLITERSLSKLQLLGTTYIGNYDVVTLSLIQVILNSLDDYNDGKYDLAKSPNHLNKLKVKYKYAAVSYGLQNIANHSEVELQRLNIMALVDNRNYKEIQSVVQDKIEFSIWRADIEASGMLTDEVIELEGIYDTGDYLDEYTYNRELHHYVGDVEDDLAEDLFCNNFDGEIDDEIDDYL